MSRLWPAFDPGRDHLLGPRHAPATLVLYGDFECPYTRAAERRIEVLRRRFGETLAFAFRHFPLTAIHPHAAAAAHAAEAAAASGRFWDLYPVLFAHQDALEDEDLARYAADLGIDPSVADEAVIRRRIAEDVASGEHSGVRGTPWLFVNGIHYDGDLQREPLARALEAAGARAT